MKVGEKKARLAVIFFGFVLIALFFGTELAIKYLLGGIVVGILAVVVFLVWNKFSTK